MLKIAAEFYPSGFFRRVANSCLRYEKSPGPSLECNFISYDFLIATIKQALIKRFSSSSSCQMSANLKYFVVAKINCCQHYIFQAKFFIYIYIYQISMNYQCQLWSVCKNIWLSENNWTLHSSYVSGKNFAKPHWRNKLRVYTINYIAGHNEGHLKFQYSRFWDRRADMISVSAWTL